MPLLSTRDVRVSAAALLRVRDETSTIHVLFEGGARGFGPPGGGFQYLEPAIALLATFGWRDERADEPDLRGQLPRRTLREFRRWLDSGTYRVLSGFWICGVTLH